YKTMLKFLKDNVLSIEQFIDIGCIDHPAALHRIHIGLPATVEHSSEARQETAKWVTETTRLCTTPPNFITFVDALKLRMRAEDQLYSVLKDLVTSCARFKRSKD
ncbi:uncharacterized protein TRAVEDRAFT_95599, partial [Trametes versicolor FP-101664 SS1]|uniref:uncharacterized protein n=1 Tax=Trametes versicolor (strain FP-101664) TaxID=717944 RepID=UPI0004622422